MRLSLSLSCVFPLACYLLLGYVLKRANVFDGHTANKLNGLLFIVLFPLNLFNNIVNSKDALKTGEGSRVILYLLIFSLFIIALTWPVACKLSKDNKRRGAFIQSVFRGNTLLFALVIANSLLDEKHLGTISLAAAVFTSVYCVFGVSILEYFRGTKPNIISLLKSVLSNPSTIGSIMGFIFIFLNIPIIDLFKTTIDSLCKCTTPLALIVLGTDLSAKSIKANIKDLSIACLLKLIVWPAIAIIVGYMLGFRGEDIVTIFAIIGVPSGVINYSTALKMDSDGEFSGEMITFSTLLSIITVFLWILVMPL